MTETPADRLKHARIAAGYTSASDAAEALGVALATYTQHENGRRGIPRDRAPLYARRFKVAEEWLLYGKGAENILSGAEPVTQVPLMGKVPGGNWREAVRDQQGWIHIAQSEARDGMYALRVEGDSMNRIVEDGAIIVIDPRDKAVFHRRLFVVRDPDGEVTFKRYMDGPGRLEPCSRNADHQPIPITERGYEIIGRVTKIMLDPDQAAFD